MQQAQARAVRPAAVVLAVGGLYVGQSIISGVTFTGLPALLRDRGIALELVGLAYLAALPWALKFLWAPAVERYRLPAVGANRSRANRDRGRLAGGRRALPRRAGRADQHRGAGGGRHDGGVRGLHGGHRLRRLCRGEPGQAPLRLGQRRAGRRRLSRRRDRLGPLPRPGGAVRLDECGLCDGRACGAARASVRCDLPDRSVRRARAPAVACPCAAPSRDAPGPDTGGAYSSPPRNGAWRCSGRSWSILGIGSPCSAWSMAPAGSWSGSPRRSSAERWCAVGARAVMVLAVALQVLLLAASLPSPGRGSTRRRFCSCWRWRVRRGYGDRIRRPLQPLHGAGHRARQHYSLTPLSNFPLEQITTRFATNKATHHSHLNFI